MGSTLLDTVFGKGLEIFHSDKRLKQEEGLRVWFVYYKLEQTIIFTLTRNQEIMFGFWKISLTNHKTSHKEIC